MNWFRNLRLGFKLSLVIAVILGIFTVVAIYLEIDAVDTLIDEAGQLRIQQEVGLIESRLQTIQNDLEIATIVIANTPGLAEAVAAGDSETTEEIYLNIIPSLELDDFDLVDKNGVRLIDAEEEEGEEIEDDEAEDDLIEQALAGLRRTSVLNKVREDGAEIVFTSIRPLIDQDGEIIGAVLLGREINDEFLQTLNFARSDIELTLLLDGQTLARSYSESEVRDGRFSEELISRVLPSQTIINPDIVFSGAAPYAEAYVPVIGPDDRVFDAVLAVHVNLDSLSRFRDNFVNSSAFLLVFMMAVLIASIIGVLRLFVTRRLESLQNATTLIGQGRYDTQVDTSGKDEISRLAQDLDVMRADLSQSFVDLEQAKTRAEQSNELKSQFLSHMSHELRTPLNGAINMLRFVRDGTMGDINDEQNKALATAEASNLDLLDFINDVLDVTKIESGMLTLQVEPINVPEVVDRALLNVRPLAKEKSLELIVEYEDNLPQLEVDSRRLRQIILNLVGNGIKFTDQGHVSLRVQAQGENIYFQVKDTGQGIKAEDHETVFQSFVQLEDNEQSHLTSSGLGLAITKQLVEMHHGRIWFESLLGYGTTFHVILPIKSPLTSLK